MADAVLTGQVLRFRYSCKIDKAYEVKENGREVHAVSNVWRGRAAKQSQGARVSKNVVARAHFARIQAKD
jgi:hypothetical protein